MDMENRIKNLSNDEKAILEKFLIAFEDMDSYDKKTLTIPKWLNVIGTELKLNFSEILRDALLERLNIKILDPTLKKDLTAVIEIDSFKFKECRIKNHLSQREVSDLCGINKKMISEIESADMCYEIRKCAIWGFIQYINDDSFIIH